MGNFDQHEQEHIESRFAFGRNWKNFLSSLSESQILEAESSLCRMLGKSGFASSSFLDAGCGSGLFSLAALRLGANEVVSFDLDPDSVDCARKLSKLYGPFPQWRIFQASILDTTLLHQMGKYDIVYSWGVLHHTGAMWDALKNVTGFVSDSGLLFISIYNDQGILTTIWRAVKRCYNASPQPIRLVMAISYYLYMVLIKTIKRGLRFRQDTPADRRGMVSWYDAVDWIGGYPFEVASPDDVIKFCLDRGFEVERIKTTHGYGCNEYVFRRIHEESGQTSGRVDKTE